MAIRNLNNNVPPPSNGNPAFVYAGLVVLFVTVIAGATRRAKRGR